MSEIKQVPIRAEIPTELTWDLTTIFASDVEYQAAYETAEKLVKSIKKTEFADAKTLLKSVTSILAASRLVEKLAVYAQLYNDQDTSNSRSQTRLERTETLLTKFSEQVAWFEPAVLQIATNQMATFYQVEPQLDNYHRFFDIIFEKRNHILSPEVEATLASVGDIFDASAKTFDILDDTDLKFPVVTNDQGEKVQLSQGVYSILLESKKRDVRQEAFEKLYSVYQQFQHTLATTLSTTTKGHNINAKLRHYETALEAALDENEIPVTVYQTLIEQVNQHLDLLHRYVGLRKKILAVPELHMYDLYTPLLDTTSPKITFDKAKEISLKALSVMGPDYLQHVEEEFEQRWIDVMENQFKRSGGYSSGTYDTNPYILLNWQDNLDNLYTLVHETGHSMHSYYSHHNQPYQYCDYSIFVAEIASTTNENLLTDYLLEQFKDDKNMQKYILNYYLDGFKGTVYRQTQFAEFEALIHQADANGQPLTADYMNQQYLKINQKYYGDNVVSDPQISLEWSRIPHFYYDFYVYQYATGFAAATTLAENIQQGPAGLTKYLNFLKAGSSDQPVKVMQQTGIDMTNAEYLEQAFSIFKQRLDQFEQLFA